MINAKRIEEMKRLSTEATEGAWKVGEVETLIRTHDGVKIVGEAWRITDGAGAKDAIFIAESRQFVPDIIAAYEEQSEIINAYAYALKSRGIEIAVLRKALEFYADEQNSKPYKYGAGAFHSHYSEDSGNIAREALAWRNTTRK